MPGAAEIQRLRADPECVSDHLSRVPLYISHDQNAALVSGKDRDAAAPRSVSSRCTTSSSAERVSTSGIAQRLTGMNGLHALVGGLHLGGPAFGWLLPGVTISVESYDGQGVNLNWPSWPYLR